MRDPKGLFLAAGAVLALTLAGCTRPPQLEFANGGEGGWQQWQGKWIVINYWAEWCAPCRKEIPELNRLHEDGKDYGVVVLGVNFDGLKGKSLERLIRRMDIEFPVLVEDPRDRWDLPLPTVLPTTVVVDPQGNPLELVGPQTYESLSRAVELSSEV